MLAESIILFFEYFITRDSSIFTIKVIVSLNIIMLKNDFNEVSSNLHLLKKKEEKKINGTFQIRHNIGV